MLTRFGLAVTLVLFSCSPTAEPRQRPRTSSLPYVAVYFFDGRALTAEYRQLPEGEPVEAVIDLLRQGPAREELRSEFTGEMDVLFESERQDRIVLEMNEPFWAGSPEQIRRRTAQLVFSLAVLEEGKKLMLLRDLEPARIAGRDRRSIRQPLTRADFREFRPWIQVIQPVAGALVGEQIPVRVVTRLGGALAAALVVGDETPVFEQLSAEDYISRPRAGVDEAVVLLRDRAGHRVSVPIRLRPPR